MDLQIQLHFLDEEAIMWVTLISSVARESGSDLTPTSSFERDETIELYTEQIYPINATITNLSRSDYWSVLYCGTGYRQWRGFVYSQNIEKKFMSTDRYVYLIWHLDSISGIYPYMSLQIADRYNKLIDSVLLRVGHSMRIIDIKYSGATDD